MPASRMRSNIVLVGLVLMTAMAGLYMLSGRPRPAVTYLALGDSYTIGTGGQYHANYANQTVQLLRRQNIDIGDPVVIARGGWTTAKLARGIRRKNIKDTFTFVSLCIGTNNQFNNLGVDNYRKEFEQLLKTAIAYTNGHADRVIVISLPDWSTTAFAATSNRQQIADDMNAYNAACKEITERHGCQ
jgi:lysophospholipase L1-like esterase